MDSSTSQASSSTRWVQWGILTYWALFWLLNVVDKVVGGAHFLWVGRDQFAQFQVLRLDGLGGCVDRRCRSCPRGSVGGVRPDVLRRRVVAFAQRREDHARGWFLAGTLFTLLTFTFFSIGDQWFGDRFELLEHTLFWFISLVSWVAYTRLQHVPLPDFATSRWAPALGLAGVLTLATTTSIFLYNEHHFSRRVDPIEAEQVGDHLYKVSFPFLGGSTVFEESIRQFKSEHPKETIDHIYTVPQPLRLKKADALIFYISTDDAP